LITYEEALSLILSHSLPVGIEECALADLLGRVLAAPVEATSDMPLFDNSAVDGFGVLTGDVAQASSESPVELELRGTIQAGDESRWQCGPGSAIKILTGATVPASVQAVVMREFCQEHNGIVVIRQSARAGENIRRRGEEFKAGEQILPAGIRITPPVLGLLAGLGHASFPVYHKPSVAVISTGDELISPGQSLQPGQIFDANSFALKSAVNALKIDRCARLHTPDDRESTKEVLMAAFESADIVISAGGVSVGDFDFVKDVSEQIGIETIFWRIALKPGKPVYFGRLPATAGRAQKLIFGLPGNPVSALVTFHQLVKPALLKIMGLPNHEPLSLCARLTRTIRKKAGRMEFVRGILRTDSGQLQVEPTTGQESHMMGGLAPANCLIIFPLDDTILPEGQAVIVELLSWSDM